MPRSHHTALVLLLCAARAAGDCSADEACGRRLTQVTVTTFTGLQGAMPAQGSGGSADIDVATSNTITFSARITIDGITVRIQSTMGAILSGGGSRRLFQIGSSGSLTVSGVTLKLGYVSKRVPLSRACCVPRSPVADFRAPAPARAPLASPARRAGSE